MRILAIAVLGILLAAGLATAGVSKKAPVPMENAAPVKQTVSLTTAGLLDCSGAIEVTLDNVYTGDNTGLLSNVAGYSCNPWYEPGGEVVFHLFLAAPTMFTATVQGDYCDVDLAILNQCDESDGLYRRRRRHLYDERPGFRATSTSWSMDTTRGAARLLSLSPRTRFRSRRRSAI